MYESEIQTIALVWNQKVIGAKEQTEKNLWMYEIDILFIMSLSFFERWDRSKYFSWST